MPIIYCKQCGAKNDAGMTECPHCGFDLKNQDKVDNKQRVRRFMTFFIVLVMLVVFLIFWLPR